MPPNFYAGQADYITELNKLATVADIGGITSNVASAAASATAAAASNINADTARDAAVVARIAAETALDSFDDRYLGPKAAAPTLDNDGVALLVGALYFDTVINGGSMRAWNGTSWVGFTAATNASAVSNTPAGNIAATTVQTALNELDVEKANLASPAFTGTVSGITSTMVGLGAVNNTSDSAKPVSTAQAAADTAVQSAAATDATTKANAAQAASAPVAHVGSSGTSHAVVSTTVAGFMIAADKVKIDAITGTNTGDQTTITGNAGSATVLQTTRTINGVAFNGSANITVNAVDATARIASSLIGAVSGVAALDATGKVPAAQLPSYVDDVLEFANLAGFPATGEIGKIYVAIDTNKAYRWSGTVYVYITSGAVDSVAGKTGIVTLVKADVGLSLVDNTSDASKPVSTAQATADALKQDLSGKDATGGYAGLTLFRLNLKNAANTITSWFTTAATAARTWTMPDKDGTVAMTSDITGVNSGTNTGDNSVNTLYSGLVSNATHTGDATGSTILTIAAGVVTDAKLSAVNTASIKGRISAGIGAPENLTGTQTTTLLDPFTSTLKGLVPASGGGTTNFLRADGTFATPAGGGGGVATGFETNFLLMGA